MLMLGIPFHRIAITAVVTSFVIGMALPAPKAAARQVRDVGRIESGTQIPVRTSENIDERSTDNRVFAGEVAEDVTDASGRVAIRRGSPVELVVREDRDGAGDLILDLESVVVDGQRFAVRAGTEHVDATPRSDDNHHTGAYVGG